MKLKLKALLIIVLEFKHGPIINILTQMHPMYNATHPPSYNHNEFMETFVI